MYKIMSTSLVAFSFLFNQGSALSAGANQKNGTAENGSVTQTKDTITIQTREKSPYGEYLTDDKGMSLYLFVSDKTEQSTCYDDCAKAWPPLLVEDAPKVKGKEIDSKLLSTFERKTGEKQVAYNGCPLYYFQKDQQVGDTKGQDIRGFGAEWYLVSPKGEKVEAK